MDQTSPSVAAASCKVGQVNRGEHALSFDCTGIADTQAVLRIISPASPKSVKVGDSVLPADKWLYQDGVLQFSFPNQVQPTTVRIEN